jgi:hypothetical protein
VHITQPRASAEHGRATVLASFVVFYYGFRCYDKHRERDWLRSCDHFWRGRGLDCTLQPWAGFAIEGLEQIVEQVFSCRVS